MSKMSNHVVLYFDILGYKALVQRTKHEDDLFKIRDAIQSSVEPLKDLAKDEGYGLSVFSDHVLFSIRSEGPRDDFESSLGTVFLKVAALQCLLIDAGLFVRGAITLGRLFHDGDFVFGLPVLEAVDLEESYAVFPRIILSPAVAELVRHHLQYYGKPSYAPQVRTLLSDSDGWLFVDYLETWEEIEDGIADWDTFVLEKYMCHKNKVEEGLSTNRSNPAVFSKFLWLARYNNYRAKRRGFLGKELDSLTIKHAMVKKGRFTTIR